MEEIAIVVNVRYEWDTEKEHEFKLFPKTSIDQLIRRFVKKNKMSGIAFFYGDVELCRGENSTFATCNIPEGALLTVRGPPAPDVNVKRKREDSPAPALGGRASSERQKTPPLPSGLTADKEAEERA